MRRAGGRPEVFTSPQTNDIDAARAHLFGMHNRMHDWTYHLGFTEETWNLQQDNLGRGGLGGDAELGNAQVGGVSGGPPTFPARNNANQITPPDGVAPTTNMYLWQPVAGSFYAPVADTDAATPLADRVDLVPGTYEFVVRAPGYGHTRIGPVTVKAGQNRTLPVVLRPNLASATAGATVAGDGINLASVADDDEATNWASLGAPVAGRQVTVDLAGGLQQDADPRAATDCATASPQAQNVRIAEFQAFAR